MLLSISQFDRICGLRDRPQHRPVVGGVTHRRQPRKVVIDAGLELESDAFGADRVPNGVLRWIALAAASPIIPPLMIA